MCSGKSLTMFFGSAFLSRLLMWLCSCPTLTLITAWLQQVSCHPGWEGFKVHWVCGLGTWVWGWASCDENGSHSYSVSFHKMSWRSTICSQNLTYPLSDLILQLLALISLSIGLWNQSFWPTGRQMPSNSLPNLILPSIFDSSLLVLNSSPALQLCTIKSYE